MPLPLEGVKVVEVAQMLAAPFAGQILGDLGADVIKVEPPDGDHVRTNPPDARGVGAYFLMTNRNKRSIAINLKDLRGQQLLRDLVAHADVFLHNMRPGNAERFGLGYEDLGAVNPRLVYCAVSGYGPTGPMASLPAFDFALQAFTGFMSVNGDSDGPPLRSSASITDLSAGLTVAMAIGFSLVGRERTGRGQRIDVSLLESLMSMLTSQVAEYDATGRVPERLGASLPFAVPYQVFQTADGNVVVGASTDRQFALLCQAIDRPDIADDDRYRSAAGRVRHRETLVPALAATLHTRPTADWHQRLEQAGVIVSVINTVPDCLHHAQALAVDLAGEVGHPNGGTFTALRLPFHLEGSKPSRLEAPPTLGQHTDEIMAGLGIPAERIAELKAEGVVRGSG